MKPLDTGVKVHHLENSKSYQKCNNEKVTRIEVEFYDESMPYWNGKI